MKKCILILLVLKSYLLSGQEYFNYIVPSGELNPNAIQLLIDNDEYIITSINFINNRGSSSLFVSGSDFTWSRYDYEGFALTRNSFGKINDTFYSYGDYNFGEEMLFFMKYNHNFDISDFTLFNTPSMNNGSTSSLFFQDHIYGASVDDYEGGSHREITLKKIDTLGNEVWSKNYNKDMFLSFAYEIEESRDSNIFIGASFQYPNIYKRYAQLTKIDTSGNIIWQYRGSDDFDNGAVPTWIAELSNGDIVMTYYIHGVQTPDIKLIWINKDGHYSKEKLIDVTAKDEFYFNQLEAGHGDYFFAYGFYRFFYNKKTFGILTKYDNDGNILWKHLYQHPDYTASGDYNSIKDIEELDNGDIVVLGDLQHPGNKNEIWLFKINANGCYGTDDCPEEIVLSTEDELNINEEIRIYPNPASNTIMIENKIQAIENVMLYSLDGQMVLKQENLYSKIVQLDVSDLTSGIYIAQITTRMGELYIQKLFIK